jgi:hypothetical protein
VTKKKKEMGNVCSTFGPAAQLRRKSTFPNLSNQWPQYRVANIRGGIVADAATLISPSSRVSIMFTTPNSWAACRAARTVVTPISNWAEDMPPE